MKGALDGVRVLDLTRVLAGPFCAMILADMGAEVIKIENPEKGDDSRGYAPFVNGESGYFMNNNRNKKGVTLNLKGDGREIFLKMVEKSDVLVENFRPGVMERLELGYEDLKKINPGMIYGCISGFGHTGPYSQRPGYDVIGQAASGIMSITGFPDSGPTKIGSAMADVLAGYSCVIGILGALHHKRNTGVGQKIDIGLMDACVASLPIAFPIYTLEGRLPERIGNRYESNYPNDLFTAKDGDLVIAAANEKIWRCLCELINRQDLPLNERYDTNAKRVVNHAEIAPAIQAWVAERTVKEAVDKLLENGIPATPINNLAQVVQDPQAKAREMFVDITHPIAGVTKLNGPHIKMSETEMEIRMPSPLLGQHNYEVYRDWLGLEKEEIDMYQKRGVM